MQVMGTPRSATRVHLAWLLFGCLVSIYAWRCVMDKRIMHSPDLTSRNIEKIAELFPTVITESLDAEGNTVIAVDFDLLRQELSDHVVEGPQERYRLDWPGKRAAAFAANAPIAKTLRPIREDSIDFDTTKNLFIEGDNLDVLKLLQESYLGKIKLIYIDPPYNTGNDFVYDDHFAQTMKEHLVASAQADDIGARLVTNLESDGRFHSNWLNMIYPRLKLARNLLKEDGVLVASIDDDELPRMRQLLDEVFGAENFYACVTWQKKYSPANDAKRFSDVHDYLLFYSRSPAFTRNLFPRTEANNKPYKHDDRDGRGRYRTDNLSVRTYSAVNDFPIQNPKTGEWFDPPKGRCWVSSRERIAELVGDNRVYWGADGAGAPQLKRYLAEVQQGTVPITLWTHEFAGHTDEARKEIKKLFGTTAVFDTPKPVRLISRVLEVATSRDEGDVVLDFFAGSATTAHAVLEKNAEDLGNRSYIMVQMAEPIKRTGQYATVADVARARIEKAEEQVKQERGTSRIPTGFGFRLLQVDTTNLTNVALPPDSTDQLALQELEPSIKPGRSGEDLIFQVLLDWGLELSLPIVHEEIDGREVFSVDDDALLACFATSVTPEVVREIATRAPLRAVFRDDAFETDAARINTEQIFREVSPTTDVRTI